MSIYRSRYRASKAMTDYAFLAFRDLLMFGRGDYFQGVEL